MKIATVLGTRPEIIRLARLIPKLDAAASRHVIIHTGQNFDPKLSDIFFEELGVRRADHYLGVPTASTGEQIGQILARCETLFAVEKPDRLLILGDTNSGLSAIIAKRMGIRVFHLEAGNRCYDDRVPEEVNRRIIDHSSDLLMPYTERSRANLLREGISSERIIVTGNPIFEVIEHYEPAIGRSNVLETLNLEARGFALCTLHRAENVDAPVRLRAFMGSLAQLSERIHLPVIVSTHPRLRARIDALGISETQAVRLLPPFGFFDFLALERAARIILTDSGTVQEECAIFGIPNITLRDVTERPETLECGSNILCGSEPEMILRCAEIALSRETAWKPPDEYLRRNVSDIVLGALCGYFHRAN